MATGALTGNPVAGFAAGAAAGAAYDGLESAAKGKPCGQIGAWKGLSEGKMENLVAVGATLIEDGMAGKAGGKAGSKVTKMVT